jgi:small-conductance mechanosensitive channel
VNVSAMLAGLGIGGIALVLDAQKILEDLFGGISIIMRDSIRVGDYCRVVDQTGTIEDIGLSSTRLRTVHRTVVSIPNAKIVQLSSENFSLRDKCRFHQMLSLHYDTSKTQSERVLADVQTVMEDAPEIESARIISIYSALKTLRFKLNYSLCDSFNLQAVYRMQLLPPTGRQSSTLMILEHLKSKWPSCWRTSRAAWDCWALIARSRRATRSTRVFAWSTYRRSMQRDGSGPSRMLCRSRFAA